MRLIFLLKVTAYTYTSVEGLPLDSCFPYTAGNGKKSFNNLCTHYRTGDVPPCRSSCINDTQPYTKYYSELSTLRWHLEVSGMQAALFQNGPMVACFSCYEGPSIIILYS